MPRIEKGARRPVKRIRRTLQIVVGSRASERRGIGGAEVGSTVYGVEETDVGGVEEVEGFGDELKALLFVERDGAPYTEVHRAEIVSHEGVSRLDAHEVVVAEDVSVGIKSRKLGKPHRRLYRSNQTEEKIAAKHVPGLRRRQGSVDNHPVANVVGGKRPLRAEVLAVLRDQHETRVWSIVDCLREGVANPEGEIVGQPPVDVEQQAVKDGVPARGGFEIDGDRESSNAGIEDAGLSRAILVLGPRAAGRIMKRDLPGRVRLVHVVETGEVPASGSNTTPRLAWMQYGFLWFWSKRTTTEGPKKPQLEMGWHPGKGFVNGSVVLSG